MGGTEHALHTLLKNIDRAKFEPVGVVVLKAHREMAKKWEETGVPVVALGMNSIPTPSVLSRLKSIIAEKKPDVVHAFLYHSIQSVRFLKVFGEKFRLVTSPRVNYRFAPAIPMIVDSLLKSEDDLILCESEAGRKSLIAEHAYPAGKVAVAWNSVDTERYAFDAASRKKVRAEWGVGDDEIVVGAVGRLHDQKGFDLLIEAVNLLKGDPVKFRTVIVGEGPRKEMLSRMAAAAARPVFLTGERTDIPAVLSAFDIFVQSSRYEGLSNALLQALSVGLPAVATAVDGTVDVAKDGENMLLAKPEDPLPLSVGIGLLLEKPSLREKLKLNARMTAAQFTVARMVGGFEQAYKNLLPG